MNIELGLGGHMKIMKSKVINRLTQKSLKILDTFASTSYYWGEKKFLLLHFSDNYILLVHLKSSLEQ